MEFNRQTIITFPDDTDIPDITTGIVSGSLNLEEILCSKNFEFGELNASKFEAQIYKLPDVSSKKIVVYQTERNNKIVLFTGIVDSCKKDKSGYYRDIVAYDESYTKRDTNVAEWCNNFWKTRTSSNLKTFRTELLKYMNIVDVIKPLYNDDLIISKLPELESIPFGTLLSSICQVQLCFPHINRLGTLEYITLSTDKNTAISITEIEGNNSTFETYYTANITRVQIYSGNDLIGIAGLEGNNYNIKDNIIFDNLGKERSQELAESMLNKLSTISMVPCEVRMLYSHLDYKLGDYIYVNGVYSYIMNNTLSGIRLVEQIIKGDADEYFSQTTAFNTTVQYAKDKVAAVLATLEAEYVKVSVADITYATIENLNATNASIDNLKTNKLDATYADIINANVESLKAANAEIIKLKANSLTADIADLKYAQIDFANVKGQVVTTSLIKDGAVTNEKVQSLSANKLTAGIIDASKITVTNLNADNITVGTINGKRIGTGSLSLDKLAEEVPTKEYLDSVQEELQGQIDGNIETFTKTEIPTLNNEPAVNWTDNATRKKHIGDICYVVNPTSSADGYSYRFANTGTEQAPVYEWVLIKDSDVTKALQDIININGEITGIKKFNVEIGSWKTDTDRELSSLKTRTTSLETDMGNKVNTTTFNEVKQTVDENSSTITKMSETLSKKADSSIVTALSNTVNSIKQTTDSNTSNISKLTTVVEKKANQDEVTSISNKLTTVEQNLNGLTVDVTNQYQYIDNQLNGNHKIYEITHAPTKDNYPANEWSIQIYPSDDRYPSDSTWEYTEDEYEKYVGTIAYWKDQQRAWRFIRKSDGTHDWVEISATETTYLLNQNASLRIDVNNISTSLSSLTTNVQNNYSTTTQMNNAITQAITKESNSIKLEVSGTYATKNDINNLQIGGVNRFIKSTVTPNKYITATGIITNGGKYWDLTDYIDVSKWKNYVASGWTNLGNALATCFYDSNKKFISGVADKFTGVRGSLPVPSNAAYMRFSFAHVDTDSLKIEKGTKATDYSPAPEDVDVKFNNYATTASLEAYIKKDPTTGELKSAIEAIADDITLNASGTINISGNKSVNINGNLFTLTSTNTTISADGTIRCDNLISSNAKITGGSINIETDKSTYSAIKLSYGDAYLKESPYSIEMYNPNVKTHNNIDAHGVSIIGDDNVVINAITDFGVDIRKGVLYVDSEATVRFDTDCNNISIYHPSLTRRCYPAMYTNNPVTFDWDGSVLRIYVDDTVVASWDWSSNTWSS